MTTQETVTQEPEQPPVTQTAVEGAFKDKTPSNWYIKPTEDGIEARSNSTGETFVGSIAEFNQKLRG